MEFDEIKKMWDAQSERSIYVINEKAMNNIIASGKEKGMRITNISELLVIVANFGAGALMLSMYSNIYLLVLGIWMIGVGGYSLAGRMNRINGDKQYDRSMLGDLDYSIDIATYQVRFSFLMRWNIIPVGLLIILSTWGNDNAITWMIGLLLFFALTFYASGWEHNYYVRRLSDLKNLRVKVQAD